MTVDDCYQLGHVVKAHGLKGHVTILLDVDNPEYYQEMESFFLQMHGRMIPFFIESLEMNGNKAIVKLEDTDTPEKARELQGMKMYLPLDHLPPLEHGQYYYHDLVGLAIIANGQKLGKINKIYQPSSQYLASITVKEKEVLIPLEESLINKVDLRKGIIDVDLPEGLLDIYLSESEENED